jgi:DNA ligase-1
MALAERLPSPKEIVEKIGKASIESKYDGFRLQCHKIGDKVHLFSRNLENMTAMFPDIVESIKKYVKAKDAIIEGEALVYNEDTGELMPFQVTMTRKRKYEIEAKKKELPLKLFVFDLLYADGKDYTPEPYSERIKAIEKYVKTGEALEHANRITTDDPAKIQTFFEESVTAGLEGVMAKRLDAPYSAGARNFNWIKLKRSYRGELADTIDIVIVGYLKGKGMRAAFGIGAVLGAVYDEKEDVFKTIAKVGSGFSEENWVKLRKELDKISIKHKPARVDSLITPDVWVEPKYVITVNADEITKSPMHTAGKHGEEPGYALRFPRAQGFIRTDKKPEDANTVKEIEEMFRQQKHVGSKPGEA